MLKTQECLLLSCESGIMGWQTRKSIFPEGKRHGHTTGTCRRLCTGELVRLLPLATFWIDYLLVITDHNNYDEPFGIDFMKWNSR